MRGLLVPILSSLVLAQTSNLELAEKLKQRKVERFFSRIEADDAMEADLKRRILALREGAVLGGEYGCIHQALLMRYPDYKRADAILLDERFTAAAEAFSGLADSDDEYLRAYARFRFGLAQMNRDRFEEAAQVFTDVINDWQGIAGCDLEAAFYRVICLGQSLEKQQAITAATKFLQDYPEAPERYRLAMEQIRNELMQEWESPLYELAGRMNHVARRIEGGDTGDQTQDKQKEIVEIIEELIRRAEQQEGQGGGQGGRPGNPRGNQPPTNPLNESQLPPGASETGDLRPKPQRKPGDQWGAMRDKEREEVLQALKEKFPDRYRELLEQYHRALAEGKRVTEAEEER